MNTFHFFKANGEFIFYITGRFGVMSQFAMIMKTIFFFGNTQTQVPFHPFLFPESIPFCFRPGADKVLHLHLLKFTHAEYKLSRHNFITESLSYLRNTKWNFH